MMEPSTFLGTVNTVYINACPTTRAIDSNDVFERVINIKLSCHVFYIMFFLNDMSLTKIKLGYKRFSKMSTKLITLTSSHIVYKTVMQG